MIYENFQSSWSNLCLPIFEINFHNIRSNANFISKTLVKTTHFQKFQNRKMS